MLGVKYSFKILLISYFEALEYSFEVRDINAAFAKENILYFLRIDYLYSFFRKIYLFAFYVI